IAGAALGRARCEAGFGHRLDGHLDAQVEGLAGTRVDDRDLAVGPDQVAADLLQRTLSGAQADPLHVRARAGRTRPAGALERLQTLERERQMRAALCMG